VNQEELKMETKEEIVKMDVERAISLSGCLEREGCVHCHEALQTYDSTAKTVSVKIERDGCTAFHIMPKEVGKHE